MEWQLTVACRVRHMFQLEKMKEMFEFLKSCTGIGK
ncbi:unnamed protein product [Rhodiola kirilowii]